MSETLFDYPELSGSSEPVSNRYKLAKDLEPGDVIVYDWGHRVVSGTGSTFRHQGFERGSGIRSGFFLVHWWADEHVPGCGGYKMDHERTLPVLADPDLIVAAMMNAEEQNRAVLAIHAREDAARLANRKAS